MVERGYRRRGRFSKEFVPGSAVNSCMTVIVRWSATYGIKRDLFQVGTLSCQPFSLIIYKFHL